MGNIKMELVRSLREVMRSDQEENLTGRTRKILMDIGIISTFVRISPRNIRQWQSQCNLDPVNFLCEIYRFVSGSYFVEEEYKKSYDCNERIILTCIAFLKLPETLMELHRRLPMGKWKKFPPKPLPPKILPRQSAKSPYLDTSFVRPDWKSYRDELRKWEKLQKFWVQPRAILPAHSSFEYNDDEMEKKESSIVVASTAYRKMKSKESLDAIEFNSHDDVKIEDRTITIKSESNETGKASSKSSKSPKKSKKKKKKKDDGSIKNSVENSEVEPVGEIISPHREDGENQREEIHEGEVVDENYEVTSDDWFFHLVGLENNNKKTFPPGRHNLSCNWQEWLLNVDEQYSRLEKEADKIIKDVRNTAKKIFNPDACDGCCACRETQKAYQNYKESKIPNIIIDSLTNGETGKKYVVGSMIFNSPPESLSESSLNQPFVIPSEDKIMKKSIINSVTIQNGETKYHMEGITKQVQHIPSRIIKHPPIPNNIPSCNCKTDVDGNEIEVFETNTERSKCRKCADGFSNKKIFVEYEKMCRRNDQKNEEMKKRNIREIEYPFFEDKTTVEEETVQEVEKCKKCIGCAEEKCIPSPFKEFLKELSEQKKLEAHEKSQKIPGKKEYRDNVKISIGGVMESGNGDTVSNYNVLTGISLQTPIELTPEPSEPSLKSVPSMTHHHHWSVTEFVPKSRFVVPDKIKTIEKKKVTHEEDKIDGKLLKNLTNLDIISIKSENTVISGIVHEEKMKDEKIEKSKNEQQVNHQGKIMRSKERRNEGRTTGKEETKRKEEVRNIDTARIELGINQNMHYVRSEKMSPSKKEDSTGKEDLTTLMKVALEKMADDGYLLAKLPECHKIPPLQVWIMYRKGFTISEKKNSDRLKKTQKSWEAAESKSPKKLVAPDMKLSDEQAAALTFKSLAKIKRKIEVNKSKFYSNVRKCRVQQSRAMWNLMEQGQYPTVSTKFKEIYFRYQASKESDGFLLKPYGLQSE